MIFLGDIPIQQFMSTKLITLNSGDTMATAFEKMTFNRIRHLPVVDDKGCLVGMFTYRDLEKAYRPRNTEEGIYYDKEEMATLILAHFITKDIVYLFPTDKLKKAAEIMAREKFGALPIVDGPAKKLVGIISYIDILSQVAKSL